MKISSIPHIYRNVNRLTEILSVFSKYGLADWLSRLNLEFAKGLLKSRDGEILAHHTRETRIRMALAELGPTFIKLGQLLSTRPDLVGRALADELRTLQSDAPADPPGRVRETVEKELGLPLEQLFLQFDEQPIASASIGQVHRAVLPSGERVVVKVQHHGIQEKVRKDLDVLSTLAQLADRLPEFAPYRPVATVAEFQRTLRRELDFGREERNLQLFSSRFAGNPHVAIPRPFTDLCTPQVLTMELLEGVKLAELERIEQAVFDRQAIARHGAHLYLEMIFSEGLYHADPHPGNVVLLPGNVIGLLDFGMVGRIDERLREQIEDMLSAIASQDAVRLATLVRRVGSAPPDLDETALRADVSDFVAHYGTQSLDQFDLGGALSEMTEMFYRYGIVLPAQVAMLLKVLITLEGTSQLLDPHFSLIEVMQPFHRRSLRARLSPLRRLKRLGRVYDELEHLAELLPRRLIDILEQVQTGKFDVHLDHRGLEPSVNRLVLGMLASALFIGSSLLLSLKVPPLLFPREPFLGLSQLSVLGLSGCVLSVLLGLRLIQAIGKSGHLDRRA